MMAKRSKLPKTPSRLIKLAMDDLNRVERLKGYQIHMGSWHDSYVPHDDMSDGLLVCHVCLAGTVMANTLDADIGVDIDPDSFDIDTANRLKALDDFRVGDVGKGFFRMGLDSEKGYPFDRNMSNYAWDRRRFKLQMRQLIRDLEAARL